MGCVDVNHSLIFLSPSSLVCSTAIPAAPAECYFGYRCDVGKVAGAVLPSTRAVCCYLGDYAEQLGNSSLSEALAHEPVCRKLGVKCLEH